MRTKYLLATAVLLSVSGCAKKGSQPEMLTGVDAKTVSAQGWTVYKDEGVEATATAEGKGGQAVRLTYDMISGGWLGIRKEIGKISEDSEIALNIKGEGSKNTVEIKLEDSDGSNFGMVLPYKSNVEEWSRVNLKLSDLEYWWGGDETLDTSKLIMHFAVSIKEGDQGGSGVVYLSGISIK